MQTLTPTLTSPVVRRAIMDAKKFTAKPFNPKTGKGDQRAALSGVHLSADGESALRIEATNGKVGLRREIPNFPKAIETVRRVGAKGSLGEEIGGQYPKLEAVVPGEFEHVFRIDKGEFLTLLELCGKLARYLKANVAIEAGASGAKVTKRTFNADAWEVTETPLSPAALIWDGELPKEATFFDSANLALAIKATEPDKSGRVWVSTNGPTKPWFVSTVPLGEQAAYGFSEWAVAMPVRIR